MPVETATYISQLNSAYPTAGDARSEGDDHLRLLKAVLLAQFPGLGAAAVTAAAAEMNFLAGVTSAIQTQLNAKAALTELGLRLLSTATASNSAAIDFTSSISSTYDEYELHIINATPSSGGTTPWLRLSADGGSSFAASSGDYVWTLSTGRGTTQTVTNGSTTATRVELSRQTASSILDFSAVIKIFAPASGTTRMVWTGIAGPSGDTNLETVLGVAYRAGSPVVNAFRFLFSSGNVASGTFKLYGVRKT